MKIGPLEFACNFPDWLLTLGEQGWLTEAAPLIYEKCAHVSVCTVVAVAQHEQLRSAPHTSFVSGLSGPANGAQPPPASLNFKTGRGFKGRDLAEFTVGTKVQGQWDRVGCQRVIEGQQSRLD